MIKYIFQLWFFIIANEFILVFSNKYIKIMKKKFFTESFDNLKNEILNVNFNINLLKILIF